MTRRRQILRCVRDYARDHAACWLRSFKGWTYQDVLDDAESAGCIVWWGCWTDDDLDMVI